MEYRVGEHVRLVRHPFHGHTFGPMPARMPHHLGDCFTVTRCTEEDGYYLLMLLPHKGGSRPWCLVSDYVARVVYSPEPLGPARASFDTLRALSVARQQEIPGAVDAVMLDLERARMRCEDR